MENKRISEMESLELISEMIRKTKSDVILKKDYNALLLYGYAAVAVSLIVWALIEITGRMEYNFVWFAMFVPYLWATFSGRGKKGDGVVTYLGSMLDNIWKVIGSMFGLTVIAIAATGAATSGIVNFSIMMPLSIIYAGIGTSMTGLVIRERLFVWLPLAGLFAAVYMLSSGQSDNSWNILFGLSFLVFMVIPAHVARRKTARS